MQMSQIIIANARRAGKTTEIKIHAYERLDNISRQIRKLDAAQQKKVVLALIGGLKGAASFDPLGVLPAINAMEISLEEFKPEEKESPDTAK